MPLAPSRTLRVFRYALYFDGVDDYVEVPHSPSYATTRHTAMITFMPTSTLYLLLSKGWWLHYRLLMHRTTLLELRITRRDRTYFVFPGAMEPGVNVWTTIAYWLDEHNANVRGAFKDGTFYTPSYSIDPSYPLCFECPNPLRIMGEPNRAFYPGYIHQILFYSRILSIDEVEWNYQYPDNPVRNGLTLWLRADPNHIRDIDGDGVLEWLDLSGFNNHGKIYGAQLVQLAKTPVRALAPARVLPVAR
jgi:hypothetical protein